MRIIIAFLLFICSVQGAIAQESPFQKEWIKIDTLELRSQVKTALKIVDSIRLESRNQNHLNDYVKASIYRWKFLKITEEDVESSIIKEIEVASAKMPITQKAIFKLLKARLLTDYYTNNRYRINQRTQVVEKSEDISMWNGVKFINEIIKTYKEALTYKEQLIKIPISDVEELVLKGLVNRQYKPTLYDFIAQEAMAFYKTPWYGIDRPAILFEIKHPSFFDSSENFRAEVFETKDTLVSSFNAVKLLQEIEKIHAEDSDPTAYVYAQLERLKFAQQYYIKNDKDELYEKGLSALSRKHNTHFIQSILQYELASYYVDKARTNLTQGYYLKAKEICETLIDKYPTSEAAARAKQLLNEINQVQLSIKVKAQVLPNKANRMLITYKNLDTLKVKIVRIPPSFDSQQRYQLGANFWSIIKGDEHQSAIVDSLVYVLPGAEDVNQHTTEVLLPKLPHGKYLIYADNKRLESSRSYAFGYTEVTKIGYTITDYNKRKTFRFYDRESGAPLENVEVSSTSTSEVYTTSGVTDAYGEYSVEKSNDGKNNYRNNRVSFTAVYNKDTLRFNNNVYPSYRIDADNKKRSKVEIFLDRGIYRPGQTLYFKGILLQREHKKSTIVPQQKAILYIKSSNGDELLEKEVITNEYGSFSGEFTIPEDVLAGRFSIYLEEPDEDSAFWDGNFDIDRGYKSFRVEAYKRPTFEITFDDISKTYTPNDTVTITGNAKAFLGSNITQATGVYKITRKKVFRNWYYYSNSGGERQLATDYFKTDDKGNFEIKFIADYEEQSIDGIFEFLIEVDITDINGETRSAVKRIKVGKKNLLTTITVSEQVDGGESIEIDVENKNLNDVQVACDNTIKIFKLDTPNRILFDRLWETPEYQQISKKAFQEAFPNELYDLDTIPKSRGALVYEGVFKEVSQYKEAIRTSVAWEAGTYVIEHTAQSKEGVSVVTEQPLTVYQPTQKYLPKNELLNYKVINKDPRKDGYVEVAIKTSLQDLSVSIDGFYKDSRFYKNKAVIDGKKIIKIQLDKSYEEKITLRLKYARFGRFFHKDIPVDLSVPEDFLEIETQTFRSKLYPDSKERWSFKIKNSEGKKVAAEVLASMYDASLDVFAKSYWNTDFNIKDYVNRHVPSIDQGSENFVNNFRVINREKRFGRFGTAFDKINFFGLDLNNRNYLYNNYLRRRRSIQKLKHKTHTIQVGNTIGIVLDVNGLPISDATITVKGTKDVVQTGFNGEFSITTVPSDILVISSIGFITQEYKVTGEVMYTTLEVDTSLEGIVITAQGIRREKKALGYAVSEVSSDDIEYVTEDELAVTISGNASGVAIQDSIAFNFSADKALITSEISKGPKKVIDFKGVTIRKNLNETAFFYPHLTTNRRGEIKFTFDAPQLLTQWRFRLLAHTKNVTSGGLEKDVITQKDLSLVPNTPRFLREGDVVELSAKIANLTDEEMDGAVQLQLFDAITMKPVDVALNNIKATQEIMVAPYGNASVFWRLEIPSGVQAVTYRMVAKAGSFSDGEENILPILSNRMMVTETVPFLVRAGEEREVTMDHLINTTSKTLTHQKFALEYTSNPSWYALQALPYLMEFPHECSEQTFSRMYANSLSAKVLNSNPKIKEIFESWKGDGVLKSALEKNEALKSILISETPWLRDAQSETEKKKRLGLLFDIEKNAAAQEKTLAKLIEKQNGDGGFPWFSGGQSNYYITRHIVSGIGHLQKLGVEVQAPEMLEEAIDYLDIELEDQLERYAKRYEDTSAFYKRIDHLHFLYARSFFLKEYPLPSNIQSIIDKSLAYYNEEWLAKSTYQKGLLAIINDRLGNREMATKILIGLKESAVQSKVNGMYWKDNRSGWFWHEAPIETQALLIEAFHEVLDDQETVEELKIWLLQQKRAGDWKTTKATAAAVYALLMTGNSFVTLDDTTQIEMQTPENQKQMDQAPREDGTGYVKAVWNGDEVTTSLGKTMIKNKGTSVGYGGMYWQYFEDLDKIEEIEGTVLNLSKSLFLVNKNDATLPLEQISDTTTLALGQTVKVRLTIKVKSNMEFVHLKDMRASGLEPIDVLSQHKYQDGVSYYQSTRDTATHFFFDNLPMGTYVLEYDVRVNNKGQFSNGISTIQSMYAPEFSNHTSGMKIIIE
ncbi:alpha-2-macroglobulin family protein [Dokdonia sp.]|uniref:alpha-2-macroglobulin family protein n=1 Tax=Dokdonia sp. TaxID=2024995 RepID=UPI003266C6B0